MCVSTLIRGTALLERLWIALLLFIWMVFPLLAAARTTQRPRIPDVGFRGLEVAWSG